MKTAMKRIITIILMSLTLTLAACSGVRQVHHLETPGPPQSAAERCGYDLYVWTDLGLLEPSAKGRFAIDGEGRLIPVASGGSAGTVPQALTIGAIGAVAGAISTLDMLFDHFTA